MRPSLRRASLLSLLILAACGGDQGGTASTAATQQRVVQGGAVRQGAAATVFGGPLANYSFSKSADGYVVTDNTGAEATRTVAATARLRFADISLSFDIDGIPGQAYRLYRAAFARTPDVSGLGFWLDALDQGYSLDVVAQNFIDSAEYKTLYANATTNTAIVNQYYLNVLNRKGEADGVAFWSNILDTKASTVAGVLNGFSESAENKSGTAAGVQNGIVYLESGVSYTDATHAFPLRAAQRQRTYAGGNDYLTISGSCSGYAAFANAAPVGTTFEGAAAYAAQTTISLGLTTCTPATLIWASTDYYDSNHTILGHYEPSYSDYDVASGDQRSLPVTARIGDKGVYAVQSSYTTNTKQTANGQRVLSYAVEADGNSSATAILKLSSVSSTSAGVASLTRVASYRIGVNGLLDQLSVDETYSNGIHLLYTQNPASAQPSKLVVTDTVTGTGAAAQSGQTLTVNYTGWLYDPTVNNFKGTQFDSSVGRGTFSFQLGAGYVIAGWDQGMVGMKVGGKRTLLIPSSLGYGISGAGSNIPGNAALVFEVELVSVK